MKFQFRLPLTTLQGKVSLDDYWAIGRGEKVNIHHLSYQQVHSDSRQQKTKDVKVDVYWEGEIEDVPVWISFCDPEVWMTDDTLPGNGTTSVEFSDGQLRTHSSCLSSLRRTSNMLRNRLDQKTAVT